MLQSITGVNEDLLLIRASLLGDHTSYSGGGNARLVERPIKYEYIDKDRFLQSLARFPLPEYEDSLDDIVNKVNDTLYNCSLNSRSEDSNVNSNLTLSRWERLLRGKDDAEIWRAINCGRLGQNLC